MNNLKEISKNIVADALNLDQSEVHDDASSATIRQWDSLALIRIIVGIEKIIGEELPRDISSKLSSIKDVERTLGLYLQKPSELNSDSEAVELHRNTGQSYGEQLRSRMKTGKILPLIGVFDQFSASLAGREFEGIFCSGYGFAASYYGLPDEGYIAWPDIVNYVERMRAILPENHIVVDIDEGYGDANIAATVATRLERVGASAVILEDQRRPKQCGHLEGKEVMPVDDYIRRLDAVLTARDEMFVVARSDSTNFEDGLKRVSTYANVGADAIMLEGLSSVEDVSRVRDAVKSDAYIVVNLIAGGKTPPVSLTELKSKGADLIIYSTPCLFHAHEAIQNGLKALKANDGKLIPDQSGIGFMENINLFRDNVVKLLNKSSSKR